LVLDGHIFIQINGKNKQYDKQSFFIIKPFQTHALMLPKAYRLLTICIEQSHLMERTSAQIYHELLRKLRPFGRIDNTLLQNAIYALYPLPRIDAPTGIMQNSAMFLRLHPESNMDVQEMADISHVSKYHFLRMFKHAVGLTPHRFQLQNRIRKAQRLIEDGMSLTDIAFATGFCDQSHFIKCFKKTVGITPSEYKQACHRT
jgi:AraC-like DNA-binding protein